jgi:hypothetical protein
MPTLRQLSSTSARCPRLSESERNFLQTLLARADEVIE